MSKDDGGAAFPAIASDGYVYDTGMSLRDYFAALAMSGFIAKGAIGDIVRDQGLQDAKDALPTLAEGSYWAADSMLKERSKA